MLIRQDFGLWPPFVASLPPRRNNSKKIWPKYLEFAKTRRTFEKKRTREEVRAAFRETMRKKKERMEDNLRRMDELELQGFFA